MDVHDGRDRAASSAKKKTFFSLLPAETQSARRAVKPYRGAEAFYQPASAPLSRTELHHRRRRTPKAINFLTAPVLEQKVRQQYY
jgi:hypothetical protein